MFIIYLLACTAEIAGAEPIDVLSDTDAEEVADDTDVADDIDTDALADTDSDTDGASTQGWQGDLIVDSEQAAEDFCDVATVVPGDLFITGTLTSLTHLACLEEVQGDLKVDTTAVPKLQLPALHTVGGDLVFEWTQTLDHVVFPALADVGGELILKIDGLDSAEFPALDTVGGLFRIWWYDGSSLEMPQLSAVGGTLEVQWTKLAAFPLPKLRTLGGLQLQGNGYMPSLGQWPLLSTDMPATLFIMTNNQLADIDALYGVNSVTGDFDVRNNFVLPTTEVEALRQSMSVGGLVTISGNQD
jgi:hypothetical protein